MCVIACLVIAGCPKAATVGSSLPVVTTSDADAPELSLEEMAHLLSKGPNRLPPPQQVQATKVVLAGEDEYRRNYTLTVENTGEVYVAISTILAQYTSTGDAELTPYQTDQLLVFLANPYPFIDVGLEPGENFDFDFAIPKIKELEENPTVDMSELHFEFRFNSGSSWFSQMEMALE